MEESSFSSDMAEIQSSCDNTAMMSVMELVFHSLQKLVESNTIILKELKQISNTQERSSSTL